MSDAIKNKQIVREFHESYNAKNLDDTWKRFIATNLINHAMGGAYDGNAWREMDKGLVSAFADFSLEAIAQPEAYIGNATTLFDERGQLINDSTVEFMKKFLDLFSEWVSRNVLQIESKSAATG